MSDLCYEQADGLKYMWEVLIEHVNIYKRTTLLVKITVSNLFYWKNRDIVGSVEAPNFVRF
jgi:hypothetical protein